MIYHKNSVDLYPNAYPRHHCKQDKPFEIEGNKHTRARVYTLKIKLLVITISIKAMKTTAINFKISPNMFKIMWIFNLSFRYDHFYDS